jgi:peptide/nickel transport system ATP-binding protein
MTPSGPQPRPLLNIENLTVWFETPKGRRLALDRVALNVARNDALSIVGESGSGKSVLSKTIMSILPKNARVADASNITFDAIDMVRAEERILRSVRGRRIAMIFQDPMTALNPTRSIGAQLTEGLRFHLGLRRGEARNRAVELLRDVGISAPEKRIDQFPHELSGGMRQRVMIAMAISCEPELLIADEATTALDVTVQTEILELIKSLRQSRDMALILITHDLGVAANYTDRMAVMYGGQILETGSTRAIFRSPIVPYTSALLDAVPKLRDEAHAHLRTIPGRARPFAPEEIGCHFTERCPRAKSACRADYAAAARAETGQDYHCWNPLC